MIGYFLRKTCQDIYHNFWTHFFCFIAISLCLGTLCFFLLLGLNLNNFLKKWQSDIPIIVFFRTEKDALEAKIQLEKRKEIENVIYISSQKALEQLEEWLELKDKKSLLEGLEKNPLFPSLEITIHPVYQNPSFLKQFKKDLEKLLGIKEIVYPSYLLSLAVKGWYVLKILMLFTAIFLSIAAVFIISSLIGFNFHKKKEEIEIMRLLGATEWFIKCPFYLMGLTQGFLASVLNLIMLKVGIFWFNTKMAWFQLNLNFFDLGKILFFLGVGVFLGMLGSFLSLRNL